MDCLEWLKKAPAWYNPSADTFHSEWKHTVHNIVQRLVQDPDGIFQSTAISQPGSCPVAVFPFEFDPRKKDLVHQASRVAS